MIDSSQLEDVIIKCSSTNYRLPKSETLANNNISQHEDVIKMQFN